MKGKKVRTHEPDVFCSALPILVVTTSALPAGEHIRQLDAARQFVAWRAARKYLSRGALHLTGCRLGGDIGIDFLVGLPAVASVFLIEFHRLAINLGPGCNI